MNKGVRSKNGIIQSKYIDGLRKDWKTLWSNKEKKVKGANKAIKNFVEVQNVVAGNDDIGLVFKTDGKVYVADLFKKEGKEKYIKHAKKGKAKYHNINLKSVESKLEAHRELDKKTVTQMHIRFLRNPAAYRRWSTLSSSSGDELDDGLMPIFDDLEKITEKPLGTYHGGISGMDFYKKPIKIDKLIPLEDEKELPYPKDLLDKDEYIIFITNGYPYSYRMGIILCVCITSFGRILGCEYKTKDWMFFDEKSIGASLAGRLSPCFLNRGWQLLFDKLHNIVPNKFSLGKTISWQDPDYSLYLTPFIVLLELYLSFFPDSKITQKNNDPDKYFEMKQNILSVEKFHEISQTLTKMDDQLKDSSESEKSKDKDKVTDSEFLKARKELKKIL